MMNTQIYDILHSAPVAKPYKAPSAHGAVSAVHEDASNFDSVSISHQEEGMSRFRKELVSRISSDIRTCTTTGRIQDLRQAVASGSYHPDPAKIAKCMLFQLEG